MAGNLANAQDLVTIEAIKQNTICTTDGRLIQILMVDGFNFSLKSEEEQNNIILGYQNFLNSIDFPLQIIIHSRKINIENYLQSLTEDGKENASALLQSQINEYRDFVKEFVKDNPIMTKTFLVVIPFTPASFAKKTSMFGLFPFFKNKKEAQQKAEEASEAEFKRNLVQLEQRVGQMTDGLRAIGLETVKLSDDALIELFYNFYNPETVERENISLPPQPQTQP